MDYITEQRLMIFSVLFIDVSLELVNFTGSTLAILHTTNLAKEWAGQAVGSCCFRTDTAPTLGTCMVLMVVHKGLHIFG